MKISYNLLIIFAIFLQPMQVEVVPSGVWDDHTNYNHCNPIITGLTHQCDNTTSPYLCTDHSELIYSIGKKEALKCRTSMAKYWLFLKKFFVSCIF